MTLHLIPQGSGTTGTISDYGNYLMTNTIYCDGKMYTVTKPRAISYSVWLDEKQAIAMSSLYSLAYHEESFTPLDWG